MSVAYEQGWCDAETNFTKLLADLRTENEQLRQSIREAAGDLLRGDADGAYEALKQTVKKEEHLHKPGVPSRREGKGR